MNEKPGEIMQIKSFIPSTDMKGKLRYLAISMVLMLILYPFLEGGYTRTIILNTLVSVICLFGVYAVSYNRKNLVVALTFGLPWFIISWMNLLTPTPSKTLDFISTISLALFYFFTAIIILSYILRSERVREDILYGAVSIYMLIGGIFNMIYLLIETIHPGSFFIDPTHNINGVVDGSDFIYYSFATLTTLGYGDIAPVTSHARSFSIIESIIGVMYLAIIISRLVGMYIAQAINKD